MASFISQGWGAYTGGSGFFGYSNTEFKSPAPIQSFANDYKSEGDNSSPTGRPIPVGLGMVICPGEIVIDPKHLGGYRTSGDKVLVNLVFCLLDTQLGGTFSLIWARANKQFIIRNQAPTVSVNSPYRFYGGSQTAVDPMIAAYLPAAFRTAWPGFVYVVFENFDIAPYDNKVPIFDFQIASSVTTVPATETQSTLTFGALDPTSFNYPFGVDRTRFRHYQMALASGVDVESIVVVDIASNVEISRSPITAAWPFGAVENIVGLDGTDYAVCTIFDTYYELALLKVTTGELVAKLDVLFDSGDPYEPAPKCAVNMGSTGDTNFAVACWFLSTGIVGNAYISVAIVNVTDETLAWAIHPYTLPALIGGYDEIRSGRSIAFGIAGSGSVDVFWTDAPDATNDIVAKAHIADTGVFSVSEVYSVAGPASKPGVAYDFTDNGLCVYRADGSIVKITSSGGVIYTASTGITDFNFNAGNDDFEGFFYLARPGYTIVSRGSINGNIYSVDLSNGTVSLIIDHADFINFDVFKYFDQYRGVMTEGSQDAGIINKITLGDSTPNTIDLADIMLALATFDGRNSSGETAFSNFPGSECYGVKYDTDTSIQDALRALREPFDISIVESDAKLKFRFPRRDGSYALDATLTAIDFVDKGPYVIEKIIGSEEEALQECTISFFDRDNYGEQNEATFARPIGVYDVTKSINRRTINLPLYMTTSRALQQAALVVYRSVYGLEQYKLSLAPGKAFLEPGDLLSFPFANDTTGFTVVAQVKDAQLNANYTQDVSAVQYLQAHDATYTGAATVVPPTAPITFYLSVEFDDSFSNSEFS